MFLPKNYLHFFLLRAPLTVAAVFPDLPFPRGMQGKSSTSAFSSVLWHYLNNSLSLQQQSQHSSHRVTGTKGSLQHNSDKRPQSLVSRGLNIVKCAESPLSLPSVHAQRSAHWSMGSKHQNTHSPSFCCLIEKTKLF